MADGDCRLVLVEWLDSRQPVPAWRYIGDVPEPEPVKAATVGWLLRDGDTLQVAQSIAADAQPQCSGVMEIPRACVLQVSSLTEI